MNDKPIYINAWGVDNIGRQWEKFTSDEPETCAVCLTHINSGYQTSVSYAHVQVKHYMQVCTVHIRERLETYYVTKEDDLYVLRQSRYMGQDHVDDICGFAPTIAKMRTATDSLFRGAVDYSEVEDEQAV
jgi:hypothetical protein